MKNEMRKIYKNEFPALLREINDPPAHLYVRGSLPPADAVFLCVVGARAYTSYGKEVCEMLLSGLASEPQRRRADGSSRIVIVSGLALGIDTIAHKAALDAGVQTIAVPGSGLNDNVLYPRANRNVAKRILDTGGALVSEFDPNWRPRPESFPQRNRIMAGLCQAVLIIEAERQSGTMITARLALDYNRDVLVVPGSIFSRHSAGPHSLLSEGATPITCPADIIQILKLTPPKPRQQSALAANKKLPHTLALGFLSGTADEIVIMKILRESNEPISKDTLIERSGLPVSRANIAISLLELGGHIKESGGLVREI